MANAREKNLFQYLLYSRPLYLTQREGHSYNVLLLGFGRDAQTFLDVCLEAAQSLEQNVTVEIWDPQHLTEEKEAYLKARPALAQFFLVEGKSEELTGEPYGEIHFHTEESKETGGFTRQQIEEIVLAHSDACYVYISFGSDADNAEAAGVFAGKLAGAETFINAQCSRPLEDRGSIHYVWPGEDPKNLPGYEDLERMAFNVHLVWSGSLNTDLVRKRAEYGKEYYHASCISNVLSMKYKLHSLGIALSDGNKKAAAKVRNLLSKDSGSKYKLAASEHRRWVTEKICDGWTNLSIEESVQYNDTKDEDAKRHICILRSSETPGLTGEWEKHSTWDHTKAEDLNRLDELDRMSVKLHQAYRNYVRHAEADSLLLERREEDILEAAEGMENVQSLFMEWRDDIRELFNLYVLQESDRRNDEPAIAEAGRLYGQLMEEIDNTPQTDILRKQALKHMIKEMHDAFLPVERCLRYHDYKKNDLDFITHIPFILTYSDRIAMVVPVDYSVMACKWEDMQPTSLFSYVAAATVVNPEKLILPYILPTNPGTEALGLISRKKSAILRYVKRKGPQTDVRFCALQNKTDLKVLLEKDSDLKSCRIVLFEDNGINNVVTDQMESNGDRLFARYTFNMKKGRFLAPPHTKNTENVVWLNDIDRKPGLTVADVADFLGRKTEVKKQPYFRKEDIRKLFKIYISDRVSWRSLCRLLGTRQNRSYEVELFRKVEDAAGEKTIRRCYTLPYTCFRAAERIVKLLKNHGIIDDESAVQRCSVDSCKVTVSAKKSNVSKLNNLFMKQYLLASTYEYSLTESGQGIALRCDGLEVKHIPFDFSKNQKTGNMRETLLKLQQDGFILLQFQEDRKSFDLTYGSREIKELFMEEGTFFEVYTYYKARETAAFDDVVTGIRLSRNDRRGIENEIDCFVTKGFRTAIVECKSRALDRGQQEEVNEMVDRLHEKIQKFGINGTGILVLDSEHELPAAKEAEGITVCRDQEEIKNIGTVINRQISRS